MAKSRKNKKVTKAVIAAAGVGTRFLPATKNVPKELIPIVNVPALQFVVDECVDSGIKDIIIVTKYGNSAIEDYFDSSPALESYLEERGKKKLAKKIRDIYTSANFIYVRQHTSLPYGNGSPLLAAKSLIGDEEPFLYLYGDDIVFGEPACKEIINRYEKDHPAAVLGVKEVDLEKATPGAVIKLKRGSEDEITKIVEKPPIEEAPSNLLSFGRYLFTPKIYNHLDPKKTGKGDELWTADAIDRLAKKERVVICRTSGTWCTMGDPIHYLETLFEYIMRDGELKTALGELIKKWITKV